MTKVYIEYSHNITVKFSTLGIINSQPFTHSLYSFQVWRHDLESVNQGASNIWSSFKKRSGSYSFAYWNNLKKICTAFIVKNFVDIFANSCLFTLFLLFQKINHHPSAKLNLKSWNSVVPIWEPPSDNFLLFLCNFLQFGTDPDLILVPNTIRTIYFGYKTLQLNMLWSIFLFIQSPQSSLFKELIPLIPSQILSGFPFLFVCFLFIWS